MRTKDEVFTEATYAANTIFDLAAYLRALPDAPVSAKESVFRQMEDARIKLLTLNWVLGADAPADWDINGR